MDSVPHTYRYETFNGLMREQNIYGNHQASSRDIATRVALMDHVRYLCDEGHSENKVMYVINHIMQCWERLKGIVHNKISAEIVQWHTSLHGRGQRHGAMRMVCLPLLIQFKYDIVYIYTVWRVIFMGLIFVESPKRPSKLIFVVLNFMTATSPGAWHCCTKRWCNWYKCSRSSLLLSHTYRDLDK